MMISSRFKNTLFGCSLAALPLLAHFGSFATAAGAPTRVRTMAANISSGNRQNYDNGEGARIFRGLKPDVVMIQEFNYGNNSPEDISKFVVDNFGETFHHYRESEASDQIPNGVISRFPILESGEWEDSEMPNRDFAWARINIPGKRDLWAISVHLSASQAPKRAREAEALVALIQSKIPAEDYVILGGDFNTTARTDVPVATLAAVVSERAAPVDSEGKSETNMTRRKNYDWVLADADLEPMAVPVTFLVKDETPIERKSSYVSGLVFHSATFPLLDRVAPVLATDSTAPGMQHLPVIKDYLIPGDQ